MERTISRRDIGYSIISRFEGMFRFFLNTKLPIFYENFLFGIPDGIKQRINSKAMKDNWEEPLDFLENCDFMDLMEIVFYKNMYDKYFPNGLISKEDFSKIMKSLYELRCKIAHVRGYFTSLDLDMLLENTQKISNNIEEYGKDFINFVKELKENPTEFIIEMPTEFICDYSETNKIPNNIPVPDYEYEGGFVGREEDIKTITNLLNGDRFRIITITGAGGVGKTALALKVIHKYPDDSNDIFDGIIWLSAKENRLSYLGIEDIEPTLKNYEQLLDTILDVMGFSNNESSTESKESDVETLFSLYKHILIVIDNLETITDERIINFIINAPLNIKFLITSRKGLGQVEKPYNLRQLNQKEAIYLFRQIAKDKNLDKMASLDNDTIKSYVDKVAYYPLAIKWVIGHVAMGKDIHDIIDSINETTSDISYFCFDHIYKGLSELAKKILCALSCFDEPPTAGVLRYVVEISKQDFEDCIRELIFGTMSRKSAN